MDNTYSNKPGSDLAIATLEEAMKTLRAMPPIALMHPERVEIILDDGTVAELTKNPYLEEGYYAVKAPGKWGWMNPEGKIWLFDDDARVWFL